MQFLFRKDRYKEELHLEKFNFAVKIVLIWIYLFLFFCFSLLYYKLIKRDYQYGKSILS